MADCLAMDFAFDNWLQEKLKSPKSESVEFGSQLTLVVSLNNDQIDQLGDQGIILGPSTENGDQAVRQQLGRCKQQSEATIYSTVLSNNLFDRFKQQFYWQFY